jgi:hypothetical protein
MFQQSLSEGISLMFFIISLVLAVCVERFTEIIIKSDIIRPLRDLIGSAAELPYGIKYPFRFIHLVITCGYCCSVWVAGAMAYFCQSASAPLPLDGAKMTWFVTWMWLHGLSNLYHVAYEVFRRSRVHASESTITLIVVDQTDKEPLLS